MDLPGSGLDIFTVSETWLNNQIEEKLTTIQGYKFLRSDRQTKLPNGRIKAGGGLGFYCKDTLQIDTEEHSNHNISNEIIELQWAVITRPHTKKILIGNVYRPPNGNMQEAFDLLGTMMKQIIDINKYETLLIGDFNADYNSKNQPSANIMRQFAIEYELQQMINKTTRSTQTSSTTIDLAFTNIKYCTSAGVLNYNISDHKPIYIIKKKVRNNKQATSQWGRTYRNCTYEDLTTTLRGFVSDNIYDEQDPNQCWDKLEAALNKAADKLCPLIELRIRNNTAKYLNDELQELQ